MYCVGGQECAAMNRCATLMCGVLGYRKYLDGLGTGYAIVRRRENVKRNIQPCSNRNIFFLSSVLLSSALCLLYYTSTAVSVHGYVHNPRTFDLEYGTWHLQSSTRTVYIRQRATHSSTSSMYE